MCAGADQVKSSWQMGILISNNLLCLLKIYQDARKEQLIFLNI